MKVRKVRYDYPSDVNEGLEKEKNWYEFQIVEDRIFEMSQDEFTQLVCDEAEHGHYLDTTGEYLILETTDSTYTFLEQK